MDRILLVDWIPQLKPNWLHKVLHKQRELWNFSTILFTIKFIDQIYLNQ